MGQLTQFYSVDPGEEHVGIACFDRAPGKSWSVIWAHTFPPEPALDKLVQWIDGGGVQMMLAEQWRVYPGLAEWSECRTAEVIGVLRHHCRWAGVQFETIPARAKKPARAFCRRKGVPLIGDTDHARDAELIGWFYLRPDSAVEPE
jgi:hypothetical protein